jgi:hypothetical protein
MEISLIGHASIFVETQDCRIVMDPVLWDPHQEGLFDVCPKREVIHEQFPEFDLLIISHRHLDHFDIRSLAYLPKTVDVLIPKDELLETCLRKLGYSQIYLLDDFTKVKIGSTTLLTTRSENRVPEYGIVFADESGVCWNQVDTVVSKDTIHFVKSYYPEIDFLLATWQPMLEINFQFNLSLSFPYSIYSKLLENVSLIQPKAIAPGANGFKYINGSSWLNQIVFPVTREQFCKDVRDVYPEIGENVFPLDPGDILVLDNSNFQQLKGMCNFVKKLVDGTDILDFSPVKGGNNIIDENPDNYNIDEMKKTINDEICFNIPRIFREAKDLIFKEHFQWKVIYQLEIVFPDYCSKWFFDFSQENVQAQVGRNPLANLYTYITASSFYGILKKIKGWDYALLGGYYRTFQKLYLATEQGINKLDKAKIIDPLLLIFPDEQILENILNIEIEKWGKLNVKASESNERKTSPIKIESPLTKQLNALNIWIK